MSQGYTGVDLDAAVTRVAQLLGERTGHCAGCGRPGRLTSGGLFPSHRWSQRGGASYCSGSDQPPTEDGGSGG